MKKLTVALTLLALLPVAAGDVVTFPLCTVTESGDVVELPSEGAKYAGSVLAESTAGYLKWADPACTWERRACEICGKTIWEKVEYSSVAIELADGTITETGMVWPWDEAPARIEAERLSFSTSRWVCLHCLTKYSGAQFGFQGVLQKAADEFIAQAKEKEKPVKVTAPDPNAMSDDTIRKLGEKGRLCTVFGHQWRAGRPGENYDDEAGIMFAYADNHPYTNYRTCRLCGVCQEQDLSWK